MEEDQENTDAESKKIELKNLLINSPEEKSNNVPSSSNEDVKPTEETCGKKTEESKAEDAETKTPAPKKKREKSKKKVQDSSQSSKTSSSAPKDSKSRSPTPPRSPEPSCAICLEQLTNKSFTNSCFHMFCFTCLVEWSKVKPECPLCKQSFTSIVHNVRSFQEYDQYHINSRCRTPDSLWSSVQRFRYRTTLTADRLLSRTAPHTIDIVNEMASHRLRYAPHSVHHMRMYSQPQSSRHMPGGHAFRRRVYEENMWVHPPEGNRIRLASPEFFQRNIACTHRLLPWLNRELLVVMPHNEGEVGFMIDLIMSLILKYNIKSQEFFTHIEPYTGPYTSHFIHEFYNFAISPYEMDAYDYHAQYDGDTIFPNEDESSPDSDVIPLVNAEPGMSGADLLFGSRKRRPNDQRRQRHLARMKRLEKLVLKRNSQNIWETVSYPFNFPEMPSSITSIPGPSTSRNPLSFDSTRTGLDSGANSPTVDDDEVEVVQVLKPRNERTPEIVVLSSDDETITSTAEVTSTVKDMSLGVIDLSSDAAISSADEDEILFLEEKNSLPDKPIDYSMKTSEKTDRDEVSTPMPNEEVPSETPPAGNNAEPEQASKKKISSVIKSAIQVVSNDQSNDSHSSSWSSSVQSKRRKTTSHEGSTTESFSDDSRAPEFDSNMKKLKLRSVVAHFSVDLGEEKTDASHHSSHKKHKDKRKKKKKHKHRHYRIYSSDSS